MDVTVINIIKVLQKSQKIYEIKKFIENKL